MPLSAAPLAAALPLCRPRAGSLDCAPGAPRRWERSAEQGARFAGGEERDGKEKGPRSGSGSGSGQGSGAFRPCRSGARGRRAVIPAPATKSGRAVSASPRQNSGKRSPGARGRRRREHGTRCLGAVPARDETRGSFGHFWFCPVTLRGYRIYLCY